IFDNLEGEDLVDAAGFLNYHGFSRAVIGELLGTPASTTSWAIKESGTTPSDNVVGLDGRAQRSVSGPRRPVAPRADLLARDLVAVRRRLDVFAVSVIKVPARSVELVTEVSGNFVSSAYLRLGPRGSLYRWQDSTMGLDRGRLRCIDQ